MIVGVKGARCGGRVKAKPVSVRTGVDVWAWCVVLPWRMRSVGLRSQVCRVIDMGG